MRSSVRNYIVRVYHPPKKDSEAVSGLVEDPERGRKWAFRSFDELRDIIRSRRPGTRKTTISEERASVQNGDGAGDP